MHPNPPPALTVRAIKAVGVEVPMTHVLGTSKGRITRAPLLLIDVETEEGVTGRSYLWSYFRQAMPAIASILGAVEECVKGDRATPQALWDKLNARFALIGVQGVVRMAMAGFDVACWDVLGKATGLSAATLLGGRRQERFPLYMAVPLGSPEEMTDYVLARRAEGIHRFQLKIGGDPAVDGRRARQVIEATGDDDIVIKSGGSDILIENNTLRHGHGISIGSETTAGVHNMLVRHCTFDGTDNGIRIKSMRGAGGGFSVGGGGLGIGAVLLALAASYFLGIDPGMLLGLLAPTSGTILIGGRPVVGLPRREVARLVQPVMQEVLKQPVIIEAKGGAGGYIGSDYVAKSAPDGYTILLGGAFTTITATLQKNPSYSPRRDLAPLAIIASVPNVLVAGPISLTLFAEIDQDDTNWFVILKDVGPDVSVMSVREYPAVSAVFSVPARIY